MVLTLVGLGLCDETDITLKGLEVIKNADEVYLESYTATLMTDTASLERLYGRPVTVMYRHDVEAHNDDMLQKAEQSNVAFLVVGDPFCATTHSDLVLRARKMGINVKVVHNASIMSSVAECGLQLYRFGQTVSIPFFEDNWKPVSFYDRVKANMDNGLHTLCLLDIKVKEQSLKNLMKGLPIFDPPRFMTVRNAIEQLLEVEDLRNQKVCCNHTKAFGIARLGSESQSLRSGTLGELQQMDFGPPMHSLVLCAETLHDIEVEMFESFSQGGQGGCQPPER